MSVKIILNEEIVQTLEGLREGNPAAERILQDYEDKGDFELMVDPADAEWLSFVVGGNGVE